MVSTPAPWMRRGAGRQRPWQLVAEPDRASRRAPGSADHDPRIAAGPAPRRRLVRTLTAPCPVWRRDAATQAAVNATGRPHRTARELSHGQARPKLAARSGPPPNTVMRAMPVAVTARTPSPYARLGGWRPRRAGRWPGRAPSASLREIRSRARGTAGRSRGRRPRARARHRWASARSAFSRAVVSAFSNGRWLAEQRPSARLGRLMIRSGAGATSASRAPARCSVLLTAAVEMPACSRVGRREAEHLPQQEQARSWAGGY